MQRSEGSEGWRLGELIAFLEKVFTNSETLEESHTKGLTKALEKQTQGLTKAPLAAAGSPEAKRQAS